MNDENQNGPEFGAIFMSNNATKKECLRRKVFALPSSQLQFVKQVKAGMILFLFEFERRELHGVFQACSDGAMNILPHAFSSSGKQFPAQVKVAPLWNCRPLSENEFHDAIRENYYSKYKFNFGLSEDQVRRLLSLFSLKRLKDQAPQRQLTRSKFVRPSDYSASKNRRLVDRSPMSNQMPGECDENNHRPVISSMHPGDSFSNDDRATDDGRVGTYTDVGYEHKATAFLNECFRDLMGEVGGNVDADEYTTNDRVDIEWNTGIEVQPAVPVRCSSGNFRSTSNDARFAKRGRIETEFYDDDDDFFAPTISTTYPSSFPNSNVSYSRTSKDSIVTTAFPYDPDVNYQGTSSLRFNHDRAPIQEYTSHDSFVGKVLGSSTNQSFPSSLETTRTTLNPDVNSGSSDFNPLSYSPNQYECSNRISLPRHDYLDNLAVEYSKKEFSRDFSPLKPSLATFPSKIGNNASVSEPSSYRTSHSKFPSLTFSDVRYPTLLQERHDYQVPEHVNDAEFGNAGFMFKESQHHGDSFYNGRKALDDGRSAMYKNVESENKESQQQHVYEPREMDYHEITSLSPAAYQHSECSNPDRQMKRSVFSRLAFPPKAFERDRNILPDTADFDMDTSVKKVMDMLHQSQYHWVKPRCKQFVKHHDHAANFRDKEQVTSDMISREMNVKPISFSEENNSKKTAETTFVDFKRRSAVRKNLEDGKNGNYCGSPNNKSALVTQCKRRKLIRPDFSGKESSERCISGDAPENIIASSAECSVSKFAENIEASVFHVNQNDTLPNVICLVAVKGNGSDKRSDSKSEQYSTESVIALRSSDEGGKQSSQSHGFSSSDGSVICQAVVEGNGSDKRSGSKSEQFSTESVIALRSFDEGGKQSSQSHGISSSDGSVICQAAVEGNGSDKRSGSEPEQFSTESVIALRSSDESVICKAAVEGNGIDKRSGSEPEQFSTESVIALRSSEEGGKQSSQSHGILSSDGSVIFQAAVEGNGSDKRSGSEPEQFSIESVIALRSSDKGGKQSSQSHGISNMASVSCRDMCVEIVQDLTTQEPSRKICEDNDADGVGKREFCYSMEQTKDLCPVGGEIPISYVN